MPATVARQKGHGLAKKLTDQYLVRGFAKRGAHADPLPIFQAVDVINATATDDANHVFSRVAVHEFCSAV